MNDAERVEFSRRLASDLYTWMLEVRHYPAEGDTITEALKILQSYSTEPKN